MNPKVSIVMSVYNAERYLEEAIDSILNQSFSDFEFVIINDGSTDRTSEILRDYTDPRVVIIDQANRGVTQSLNKAMEMARGQYIARMDADDISLPQRFQMQVEFLENNLTVGLVGTSVIYIDEDGKTIMEGHLPTENTRIKEALLSQNPFCHGSVMFRRECIRKVGGYREGFKRAQDYDLWLRIAEYYEVANLIVPLYNLRITAGSISFSHKLEQDRYAALARQCVERRKRGEKDSLIIQETRVTHGRIRSWAEGRWTLAWHYYVLGRAFLSQRRMQKARSHFGLAIKSFPFDLKSWVFYLATYVPNSWLDKLRSIWHRVRR